MTRFESNASKYGVNEGLILTKLEESVVVIGGKSYVFGMNKYDWVPLPLSEWEEAFPFLTGYQIQRALKSLEKQGALEIENRNKSKMLKTLSYRLVKDAA